jgi:hypothetical protein
VRHTESDIQGTIKAAQESLKAIYGIWCNTCDKKWIRRDYETEWELGWAVGTKIIRKWSIGDRRNEQVME